MPSKSPQDYYAFKIGDVLVIYNGCYVAVLKEAVLDRKDELLRFRELQRLPKGVKFCGEDAGVIEDKRDLFFAYKKKGEIKYHEGIGPIYFFSIASEIVDKVIKQST